MSKPILWVSLTSNGRVTDDERNTATLEDVETQLRDADLDDDYTLVVADDRTRLLSRDDALALLGEALNVNVTELLDTE